MSQLADQCGLQEESSRCFASSSKVGPQVRQPFGPLTGRDKADLTLAVVGLSSATRPWTSKVVTHDVSHPVNRTDVDGILQDHTSASPVVRLVSAVHSAGFGSWEIDFHGLRNPRSPFNRERTLRSRHRRLEQTLDNQGTKKRKPLTPNAAQIPDGRLSDPEPHAPWKVTVPQILNMSDNPAPLRELQTSDVATSHDCISSSSSRRASILEYWSGNASPFSERRRDPVRPLQGRRLTKQAASLNVQPRLRNGFRDN